MVTTKALILIQTLLLLSQGVFGQQLQPNASLYIPAIPLVHIENDELLIASEITTKDSSTIYQIIDAKPTATGTFTLEISPTGASLQGSDSSLGAEDLDLPSINSTCTFSGNTSSCDLIVAVLNDGEVETLTSKLSESTNGIPVVALNFGASSTSPPAPAPTTTGASNTTAKTSSAVKGQLSMGSFMLIAFTLLSKLM